MSLSILVKRVVPISPLADLEPISLTTMNADLRLDPVEMSCEMKITPDPSLAIDRISVKSLTTPATK